MAASGVGSTVAALWVASRSGPARGRSRSGRCALGLGSIVLAVSIVVPALADRDAHAGAGGIAMAVPANATIQLAVPDQLRGRVMSVYTTVFAGSVPLGGLLMGAIASAWSVPMALMVGAVGNDRGRRRRVVLAAPDRGPNATRRRATPRPERVPHDGRDRRHRRDRPGRAYCRRGHGRAAAVIKDALTNISYRSARRSRSGREVLKRQVDLLAVDLLESDHEHRPIGLVEN